MTSGDDGWPRPTNNSLVVIVVVAAAFAAAAVLYIILQPVFARFHPSRPLPPVQLLAHHRLPPYLGQQHKSMLSLSSLPSSSSSTLVPSFDSRKRWTLSSDSLASSSSTARSFLRGVPHAPHNHVQIVLPSPLAATFVPPRKCIKTHSQRVDAWASFGNHVSNTFSAQCYQSPHSLHVSYTTPPLPGCSLHYQLQSCTCK